ncbi:MAG: YidH family protein [Vicinamibacterales bacterium]
MSTQPPALDSGTRLAVDRTRLAYERTMMAWVRTATSLISFGFTIYKFFELELRTPASGTMSKIGPREFALLMITMGLVALTLAGIQHYQSLRSMRESYGQLPRSVAGPVAALIGLLGLVALTGVYARI